VSSPPVAEAIQAFPEVEAVTRLEPWNPVLRVDGRYASGDTYYAVDPGFLDVFTFPLVAGDAATALNAPNTLVVTSVLTREGLRTTGVAADVPAHSHFNFDFLTAHIDASALPAGVYLVRVTAQTAGGAVTATVPLTIIR
jgi:putative ABC transport system permease protein